MENALMTHATASMTALSETETAEILSFVSGNVAEINQLTTKILAAQDAADTARGKVVDAKHAAESAKKKADERSNVHWYDGKAKAINDVQADVQSLAQNQVAMAESQIALAEVQQRSAEAQEMIFDFQKKLAGTTAMMIKFSTASIATSRLVVRELEARMNGASQEELSDLARKELESVVYQIKAQQDIMSRQDQLTDIVREIDERVSGQREADVVRDEAIEEQMKKGTQRDLRILEHDRTLRSHQRILSSQQQKDLEHDQLIAQVVAKDGEQDAKLNGLDEHNIQQDKSIAQGVARNDEQDGRLNGLDEQNARQDAAIAQGVAKDGEQDARLNGLEEHNAQQDAAIAQSAARNDEQDARLNGLAAHNAQQDAAIAQNAARNDDQDARLTAIDTTNAEYSRLLQTQAITIEDLKLQIETLKNEKGNKVFMYVTAAATVTTLILSILHFFI